MFILSSIIFLAVIDQRTLS